MYKNTYNYKSYHGKSWRYKKYEKETGPINSYGIILFSYKQSEKKNIIKDSEHKEQVVLLYQRRDNFGYIDFLRGAWSNDNQIIMHFSTMSMVEKNRIRNYTFRELWDDLWVNHNCRIYKDGYPKSKKKYESIKHIIPKFLNMSNILESSSDFSTEKFDLVETKTDLPWGFPKGKKNNYENKADCALREFSEETRLPIKNIHIHKNISFSEEFIGTNGKTYATTYFLANIPEPVNASFVNTPQCIRKKTISEEAADVKWFDFEEAKKYLNPRRRKILEDVKIKINEISAKSKLKSA